jgi:hypothetical protein
VNRRRKPSSLFEKPVPEDVGEHFLSVFGWAAPLVTSSRGVDRTWMAGNRQVSTSMVSGVIGFERDSTGQDSWFDLETQSWQEAPLPRHLGSQAPFLFDSVTRNLWVLKHREFKPAVVAQVFEQLLVRGEMLRDPSSPVDWEVDPVLSTRDYERWLAGIDRLESVSYILSRPNPDAEESFAYLARSMEANEAREMKFEFKERKGLGLSKSSPQDGLTVGLEEMSRRGFAVKMAVGMAGNLKKKFDQRVRTRLDAVPAVKDHREATEALADLANSKRKEDSLDRPEMGTT